MYSRSQQRLDDGGARGRRAEPRLPHRVRELLLVQRLARRLHRGQQRRVGEARRRPRPLRHRLRVAHRCALPAAPAPAAASWLVVRLLAVVLALLRPPPSRGLGAFCRRRRPAPSSPRCSTSVPVLWKRSTTGARRAAGERHRGDDRGHRPDVVLVPGREQAAADQVVDPPLVRRQRARPPATWRVGMMAWWSVTFASSTKRRRAGARPCPGASSASVGPADGAAPPRGSVSATVRRQVPAVGARVAEELVLLVERLRHAPACAAR